MLEKIDLGEMKNTLQNYNDFIEKLSLIRLNILGDVERVSSKTIGDNEQKMISSEYYGMVFDEKGYYEKTNIKAIAMSELLNDYLPRFQSIKKRHNSYTEILKSRNFTNYYGDYKNELGNVGCNSSICMELVNNFETMSSNLSTVNDTLLNVMNEYDSLLGANDFDEERKLVEKSENECKNIKSMIERLEADTTAYKNIKKCLITELELFSNDEILMHIVNEFKTSKCEYISYTLESNLMVRGNDGRIYYGGNQAWFSNEFKGLSGYGCGIIAAVNTYLIMAGVYEISQDEYMKLVRDFLIEYPMSIIQLETTLGVFPNQMGDYIEKHLKKTTDTDVKASWDMLLSNENQYDVMKKMINEGQPVIWGLFTTPGHDKLRFYTTNDYINYEASKNAVSSHYVTVTGLYEIQQNDGTTRKMIEIYSWGSKYYIDYDEYLDFSTSAKEASGIKNSQFIYNGIDMNSLDFEEIILSIGSNILQIE